MNLFDSFFVQNSNRFRWIWRLKCRMSSTAALLLSPQILTGESAGENNGKQSDMRWIWNKKSETSNREEEATLQKGGMSACTSGLVKKKRRQLGLFFKEDPGWRLFLSGPLDRAQAMQGRPCPICVARGQWELVWNMIRYYDETWWSMIKHAELWWNMMKYDETLWWNMMNHDEIDETWWSRQNRWNRRNVGLR